MQPEDKTDFHVDGPGQGDPQRPSGGCHLDGGDFLLGVLAGAAVGAGLAILFAPQSGVESRGDIRRASESLRDRTTGTYGDAREAVEEWIAQARETVEETRRRLDEAVEAGRVAAARKRAELDAQVDASLDV